MKKVLLVSLALASLLVVSATRSGAVTLAENFATDPLANGWQLFGDTNLFRWNPTNQNLEVTWDSSQINSYFYHPLGTILTRKDDFSVALDLELQDVGTADSYLYSFELAVGFFNLKEATQPDFVRGAGANPDLVELAYFRADDFGDPATVYPTCTDTNSNFNYNGFGAPDSTNYTLITSNWYHVSLAYTASNQTIVAVVTNLAGNSSATVIQPLAASFTDFRADTISINSYNDAGQFPGFEGSILVHGIVSNLVVVVPPAVIQNLAGAFKNGVWQAQFISQTNWFYTLEWTTNLVSWTPASAPVQGNGTNLVLTDTHPVSDKVFYRIQAERP